MSGGTGMEQALVIQLGIAEKEVAASAQRVNRMLKIKSAYELTEMQQKELFNEWLSLATRLRRGKDMIDEMITITKGSRELLENKRYKDLTSLYEFLMSLLGFYDLFFKTRFPEDIYQSFQLRVREAIGNLRTITPLKEKTS